MVVQRLHHEGILFFLFRVLWSVVLLQGYFFWVCQSSCVRADQHVWVFNVQDVHDTAHMLYQLSSLPEGYTIGTIEYTCDIPLSKQEFYYAIDFKTGDVCSPQAVMRSCFYLFSKKKFETITLTCVYTPEQQVLDIQFELKAIWTFSHLYLQGLLYGIDTYRPYYLLQEGEPFEYQKHLHSLQKMQEALCAQGYMQPHLYDYLAYDETMKSVAVTITIERGVCYRLEGFQIELRTKEGEPLDKVAKKIEHECQRWHHAACTQETLDRQERYIKSYLTKKGFLYQECAVHKTVHHDSATVDVAYTITVYQRKRTVFLGNTFFSQAALFDHIHTFAHRGLLLPDTLIKDELSQKYHAKGFWDIDIGISQETDRSFFIIKQGQRAALKEVHIEGSSPHYAKTVQRFFSGCIKNVSLDEEMVQEALAALEQWYYQQGFWDIHLEHRYERACNKNAWILQVTVHEGRQYRLSSIHIPQYPELLKEGPFALLKGQLPTVGPLKPLLQEQQRWLQQYFFKQGYIQAHAQYTLHEQEGNITVVWNITGVDQPTRFGKIIVVGAPSFPFAHIQRELAFLPGDIWSKKALEESCARLRKLGIFESISLQPLHIPDQPWQKPIVVMLTEADPFEIRLRAGFQQVSKNLPFHKGSTYKVGGTLWYRNPSLQGDSIKIDTDVTKYYRNVEMVYQRPWLWDKPIVTIIKGYSNKYTQPVFIGSNKPLYQAIQQGILWGISRTWQHYALGCNSGFEWMETDHITQHLAEAINFQVTLINQKIPYFYAEPSVVINFLDNQMNPSCGLLTVVSGKMMIPLSKKTVHFFKIVCEQSFFLPVKSLVFGFRLRFGHIFNQDFKTIMPPERFYLGGQNSLRSYEANQAPPLGSFINEEGKREFVPQGGRSMVNVNLECRIPLYGSFGAVLFQDLGTLVEHSFAEVKGGRLLFGTGCGVRYYSPVGPVRFDIGWKWRKEDPAQSSYAWFLMLGHAF